MHASRTPYSFGPPWAALALLLFPACVGLAPNTTTARMTQDDRQLARESIDALLDDWHRAASEADGERYFGHFTEDAVFLGTDASERWSVEDFRAYAAPYFDRGQGWTYTSRERHVQFSADGRAAWFDERLWNDKYGECRGTGALRLGEGGWRLAHYSLTFPIPNDLAAEFTGRIRELSEAGGESGS